VLAWEALSHIANNSIIARDFHLTGAFQRLNAQMAHLPKARTAIATEKFTSDDAKAVFKWLDLITGDWRSSPKHARATASPATISPAATPR
jgi:hypothetical protein